MADDKKKPERDHASDMLIEWAPRINMWVKKLKNQGMVPGHIDETDLHSAGMDGLMDAFHRYEKGKGEFGAFANHRIRGKMLDHITTSGGSGAVDKLFRDQAKQFKAKQQSASQAADVSEPAVPSSSSEKD